MIRRTTHLAPTNPPYERNIHRGGRHGVDARARIANAAPHRCFGGGRGRRTPGGEIGAGPDGAIARADRPTALGAALEGWSKARTIEAMDRYGIAIGILSISTAGPMVRKHRGIQAS